MQLSELEAFCDRPARLVAPDLVGAALTVDGVGGLVVEAEAYEADDPASHSFAGPTARNAAMFGPPARAYVYRCYGVHWCFNVVCRSGSAVLVRALEPKWGLEAMAGRRGGKALALASGPGRLTQALGITRAHDGMPLAGGAIVLDPRAGACRLVVGTRIGISKAVERPWRFGLSGSAHLSRPFRSA